MDCSSRTHKRYGNKSTQQTQLLRAINWSPLRFSYPGSKKKCSVPKQPTLRRTNQHCARKPKKFMKMPEYIDLCANLKGSSKWVIQHLTNQSNDIFLKIILNRETNHENST